MGRFRKLSFLICAALVLQLPPRSSPSEAFEQAFAKLLELAVVRVRRATSEGSGVVVRIQHCGTFLLTAGHVIKNHHGPIIVKQGGVPGAWHQITYYPLVFPLDVDLALLSAPPYLHPDTIPFTLKRGPVAKTNEQTLARQSTAIGLPIGSTRAQMNSGYQLPKLHTPLLGGHDLPLVLKLQQGMSGGLLLYPSEWEMQGLLTLHADPAWPQDLIYADGTLVPAHVTATFENLSFAISAQQIERHLMVSKELASACTRHGL